MLVRLKYNGSTAMVRPDKVVMVIEDSPGVSLVLLEDGQKVVVSGDPDEVHAALFPPTAIFVSQEQQTAIREAMRVQALGTGVQWFGGPSGGPLRPLAPAEAAVMPVSRTGTLDGLAVSSAISAADVTEALDPSTYEEEWATHTPEQMRAMSWALSLVRARLGVELKP